MFGGRKFGFGVWGLEFGVNSSSLSQMLAVLSCQLQSRICRRGDWKVEDKLVEKINAVQPDFIAS